MLFGLHIPHPAKFRSRNVLLVNRLSNKPSSKSVVPLRKQKQKRNIGEEEKMTYRKD